MNKTSTVLTTLGSVKGKDVEELLTTQQVESSDGFTEGVMGADKRSIETRLWARGQPPDKVTP